MKFCFLVRKIRVRVEMQAFTSTLLRKKGLKCKNGTTVVLFELAHINTIVVFADGRAVCGEKSETCETLILTDQPDRERLLQDNETEHPCSKSLSSSTFQGAGESDIPYSPVRATQAIPTNCNNSDSSISGPPIPMPEHLDSKLLSASTVQGARESAGPCSPIRATQSMLTKHDNSDLSISGPPITVPKEWKGHGTTVMGFDVRNKDKNIVVKADGRAVSRDEAGIYTIISDGEQDLKLMVIMDYAFAAAGDSDTCEEILKRQRDYVMYTRRENLGRLDVKELADNVKIFFDKFYPKSGSNDVAYKFRKLWNVAILCIGYDKNNHGETVVSMWVGTKAGSWKVDRFEALGTGASYADLEVDTSKKYKKAEEVSIMLDKALWRASFDDFCTAGGVLTLIFTPLQVPSEDNSQGKQRKRKKVAENFTLGRISRVRTTVKELMKTYGEFDDRSLADQSVDESYAVAVRGRGNTLTLSNSESWKEGEQV